jgi:hypothetical protein
MEQGVTLIVFILLLGTYCTSMQMRMYLLVHGLLGWKLNILMRGACVVVPHQVRLRKGIIEKKIRDRDLQSGHSVYRNLLPS